MSVYPIRFYFSVLDCVDNCIAEFFVVCPGLVWHNSYIRFEYCAPCVHCTLVQSVHYICIYNCILYIDSNGFLGVVI